MKPRKRLDSSYFARIKRIKSVKLQKLPWSNRREFINIYKALYSNDSVQSSEAFLWLGKWDVRTGQLPAAVDTTQSLVRAFVEESTYLKDDEYTENLHVRKLFVVAIIRFVNLITELGQNYKYKQTLSSLAKKLKIPEWVVETRHMGAHSDLPPLNILHNSALLALFWLRKYYWRPEVAAMSAFDKDFMTHSITEALFKFQYVHLKILYYPEIERVKIIIAKMLKNIMKFFNSNSEFFIEVFVFCQTIVPTIEILQSILTEKEWDFVLCENELEYPESLIKLWLPIIEIFDINNYIEHFLECLIYSLKDKNDYQAKFIIAFAIKLIDAIIILRNEIEKKHNPSLFEMHYYYYKRPSLNWLKLLKACITFPCKYTLHLLDRILKHCSLTAYYKGIVYRLIAIYLGKGANLSYNSLLVKYQQAFFSVADLDTCGRKTSEFKPDENKRKNSKYYAYTKNWHDIPLGTDLRNKEFIRPGHKDCTTPELSDESDIEESSWKALILDEISDNIDIPIKNNKDDSESTVPIIKLEVTESASNDNHLNPIDVEISESRGGTASLPEAFEEENPNSEENNEQNEEMSEIDKLRERMIATQSSMNYQNLDELISNFRYEL